MILSKIVGVCAVTAGEGVAKRFRCGGWPVRWERKDEGKRGEGGSGFLRVVPLPLVGLGEVVRGVRCLMALLVDGLEVEFAVGFGERDGVE